MLKFHAGLNVLAKDLKTILSWGEALTFPGLVSQVFNNRNQLVLGLNPWFISHNRMTCQVVNAGLADPPGSAAKMSQLHCCNRRKSCQLCLKKGTSLLHLDKIIFG